MQNRGMLESYLPRYRKGLPNGSLGCDGSGIRLGQSAGGATSHMDHASAWRFINPPLALAEGVIVNADAQCICNESAYGAQIGYAMCEENDGRAWVILDNALYQAALEQCRKAKMWKFQSLPALLSLYANAKLTSVEPFHNLTTVKGEFIVKFSGASAQQFPNLECVGSYHPSPIYLRVPGVRVGGC